MSAKRSSKSKLTSLVVAVAIIAITAIIGKFSGFDISNGFNKSGLRDENAAVSGTMNVNFIDIGQGDSTLITSGDIAILIDGGESGEAQTVINYIKNQNISDIDCLIATHPHSDHIGSLAKVMEEIEVKDVIMPEIPEKIIPTTSTYEKFLNAVGKYADNVIAAKAGSTYSYGDIDIDILAPLNDYDDLNDMSVVAKVVYGSTSVMMTGDATFNSEKDMLEQNVNYKSDILKVGHHGSKNSTSDEWLDAVNPQYAVISCGAGNDYGHPNKKLTDRLESHNVEYFRTDLLGSIVFSSDGTNFTKCD